MINVFLFLNRTYADINKLFIKITVVVLIDCVLCLMSISLFIHTKTCKVVNNVSSKYYKL